MMGQKLNFEGMEAYTYLSSLKSDHSLGLGQHAKYGKKP